MNKIIIAIDGHSGCGKSTLARQLAEKLGYLYIDTGAMYRAVTLYYLVDCRADKALFLSRLDTIKLTFENNSDTGSNEIILNNKNVENEIRGMSVANHVSEIAAIPEVRKLAVSAQKKLAAEKGVVMDGRDIGTVVFPHAELKIFLTASISVRVERRFKEFQREGREVSRTEVEENLKNRDYKDTHRKESPLRRAEDAIVIDNSYLSRGKQLQKAVQLAKEAMT